MQLLPHHAFVGPTLVFPSMKGNSRDLFFLCCFFSLELGARRRGVYLALNGVGIGYAKKLGIRLDDCWSSLSLKLVIKNVYLALLEMRTWEWYTSQAWRMCSLGQAGADPGAAEPPDSIQEFSAEELGFMAVLPRPPPSKLKITVLHYHSPLSCPYFSPWVAVRKTTQGHHPDRNLGRRGTSNLSCVLSKIAIFRLIGIIFTNR